MKRDSKGRFVYTTGKGRYKRVYSKHKNHLAHRYIWEQINGPIPKGHIIHHIDGDKFNNNISNLQCMTIEDHNKFHCTGRSAWNKNIPTPKSTKNKISQIKKQNYWVRCVSTYFLNEELKPQRLVAKLEGITRRQVADRLNGICEVIKNG